MFEFWEPNKRMHGDIENAIRGNTATITVLIDWIKANKGAATSEQVSSMHTDLLAAIEEKATSVELASVYNKIVRTHLPEMEKRIIEAIKASDDKAIVKATTVLKTSTDQLEKVVEDNQPISG